MTGCCQITDDTINPEEVEEGGTPTPFQHNENFWDLRYRLSLDFPKDLDDYGYNGYHEYDYDDNNDYGYNDQINDQMNDHMDDDYGWDGWDNNDVPLHIDDLQPMEEEAEHQEPVTYDIVRYSSHEIDSYNEQYAPETVYSIHTPDSHEIDSYNESYNEQYAPETVYSIQTPDVPTSIDIDTDTPDDDQDQDQDYDSPDDDLYDYWNIVSSRRLNTTPTPPRLLDNTTRTRH